MYSFKLFFRKKEYGSVIVQSVLSPYNEHGRMFFSCAECGYFRVHGGGNRRSCELERVLVVFGKEARVYGCPSMREAGDFKETQKGSEGGNRWEPLRVVGMGGVGDCFAGVGGMGGELRGL